MQKKIQSLKLVVPFLTFLVIVGIAFAGRLPSTLAVSLSNFGTSDSCAGHNYSYLPNSDCNTNTPDPSPGSCQLAWMNGGGGTVALDVSKVGDDQGLRSTLEGYNLRCAPDVQATSCTLTPGANDSGSINLDLANVMNRSPWIYQQLHGQFGLDCNNTLVSVPLNSYQSFQVTTPGYTDRFIRHSNSLGYTEVVNSGSSQLLKQDATFKIVAGLAADRLADASCYSFQSRNYPRDYLRHFNYRIHKDPNDGSMLFKEDATFCALPGLSGTGVSFRSYNYPDRYIRHINAEVWISSDGGPNAWDNANSYVQDVSWNIVAPCWTDNVA